MPIATVVSTVRVDLPGVTSLSFGGPNWVPIVQNTVDNSEMATFTYTADATPISATIEWQDGSTTIATIVNDSGTTYGVYAADMHYYADASTYTGVKVTLLLPDGSAPFTTGSITPEASTATPPSQPAPGSLSAVTGLSYVLDTDLAALTVA